MIDKPKRRADRVFDPSYVQDLGSLPMEEIRSRRLECSELEAELSYGRRLLQGKLDIVRHELTRRAQGGESSLAELVSNLPQILADDGTNGAIKKHNPILLPKNADKQRREVDGLAPHATLSSIESLSSEELAQIAKRLTAAESQASEQRRNALRVMDDLTEEMIRRYRDGIEDVSALLAT